MIFMTYLQKILPLLCFINTSFMFSFLKEVHSSELSVNQNSILEKFLLSVKKRYQGNFYGQNKVKRCLCFENETDRTV